MPGALKVSKANESSTSPVNLTDMALFMNERFPKEVPRESADLQMMAGGVLLMYALWVGTLTSFFQQVLRKACARFPMSRTWGDALAHFTQAADGCRRTPWPFPWPSTLKLLRRNRSGLAPDHDAVSPAGTSQQGQASTTNFASRVGIPSPTRRQPLPAFGPSSTLDRPGNRSC